VARARSVTMKAARRALRISLALRERAGVRERATAAATYIIRGGADAMAVSVA
jgi:Flp pilus assembly protein CpaB